MPQSSSEPYTGPYRKPRVDLYSILLIIALAAVIAGCVVLYVLQEEYGASPFKSAPPVGWNRPAVTSGVLLADRAMGIGRATLDESIIGNC